MDEDVEKVVKDVLSPNPYFRIQVEKGSTFGRELASALFAKGFRFLESGSTCKVASYEVLMGNGSVEVEITCGNFMGAYTIVDAHPQTRKQPE